MRHPFQSKIAAIVFRRWRDDAKIFSLNPRQLTTAVLNRGSAEDPIKRAEAELVQVGLLSALHARKRTISESDCLSRDSFVWGIKK